jgi:NAD+--asparagine ADP-ribosyltransferase
MPTTPEQKSKAKRGIRARVDAVNTLIQRHQAEFDELHAQNRVAAGLTPRSSGPTREQLEERIKRQRERLDKWEKELQLS